MTTATIHEVTAEEFAHHISNPLADSIYAHYAHAAMSADNMAHVYNYMLVSNINPMHTVEQHLDVLAEAEHANNL
jgi:hypothetical protein